MSGKLGQDPNSSTSTNGQPPLFSTPYIRSPHHTPPLRLWTTPYQVWEHRSGEAEAELLTWFDGQTKIVSSYANRQRTGIGAGQGNMVTFASTLVVMLRYFAPISGYCLCILLAAQDFKRRFTKAEQVLDLNEGEDDDSLFFIPSPRTENISTQCCHQQIEVDVQGAGNMV